MSIFTEMPCIEVILSKLKLDEPLQHVNNCYMSKHQALLIALVIREGIQLEVFDPQHNQVHNGVNIVLLA
jgi:hypothetical protein